MTKNNTILAAVAQPGEPFKFVTIENNLTSLQSLVGGYIEPINSLFNTGPNSIYNLAGPFTFYVNEVGKLLDLQLNRTAYCPYAWNGPFANLVGPIAAVRSHSTAEGICDDSLVIGDLEKIEALDIWGEGDLVQIAIAETFKAETCKKIEASGGFFFNMSEE